MSNLYEAKPDAANPYGSPSAPQKPAPPKKPKPDAIAYLVCGWPLLLLFVGGAIGGGLGGLAFGLNMQVYQSKLPLPVKFILIPLFGILAAVLYVVIVLLIFGTGE